MVGHARTPFPATVVHRGNPELFYCGDADGQALSYVYYEVPRGECALKVCDEAGGANGASVCLIGAPASWRVA